MDGSEWETENVTLSLSYQMVPIYIYEYLVSKKYINHIEKVLPRSLCKPVNY